MDREWGYLRFYPQIQYTFKAGAFGLKEKSNDIEYGLIAQEVEKVIPDIVMTEYKHQ